jgi:hypothetical protein
VKAAATAASYTAYAGGDYEGACNYFAAADKKLVSRSDCARVMRALPRLRHGVILNVAGVRVEGDAYLVTITVLGVAASTSGFTRPAAGGSMPRASAGRNDRTHDFGSHCVRASPWGPRAHH